MWRHAGALLEPPYQRSGRQPACLGQFRDGYAFKYPLTYHLRDEALLPWRERKVIGLYYYMRIANAMLMRQPVEADPVRLRPAMSLALAITALGTVGIGLFPNFFINAVNWSLGLTQGAQGMASLLR